MKVKTLPILIKADTCWLKRCPLKSEGHYHCSNCQAAFSREMHDLARFEFHCPRCGKLEVRK